MSAATNIPVAEEFSTSHAQVDPTEFRQRIGTISRHSAAYFAGTVFTAGAGYLFKIYVARALGPSALGLYALGMSLVGFVGLFNALGLPTAASRFIPEYSTLNDYKRLTGFLRGSIGVLGVGNLLVAGVFVAAMPWIAVHFYHSPALASYVTSFAVIMVLGVFTTFLAHCMAGFREIARRTVITQFLASALTIVTGVTLIRLGFGLRGYLVAQIASSAIVLVLLTYSVWALIPHEPRAWRGSACMDRKVFSFSGTAFGIGLVHFALGQSDKIVLGYYMRPKDVGVYAVAVTVAAFVPIALQSVNQIFSPMIAELRAAGNHLLLRELYAVLTRWTIIFTLPLAFTVILFAPALMSFFGPSFERGAIVLSITAAAQLVNCGVGSVGFLLLMSGYHNHLMKIQVVNAVVISTLSILLVPRFGIVGAAVASSASITGTNLWALMSVRRRLALSPYDRSYFKLAAPAAVSALILLLLRQHFGAALSWRVALIACLSAYASFCVAFAVVGFTQEDRMFARVVWNRFRNGMVRIGG